MSVNVLEICAKLNIGGAQLVAANISRYAPEDIKVNYLVFGDEIGDYEEEIVARGDHIIHHEPPRGKALSFLRDLTELMKKEKYDVVHCHTMFSSGVCMLAAKRAGVPGRICHSHTAKDDAPRTFKRKIYRRLMRWLMHSCSTDYLACGIDAGRELYGRKWFDHHGKVIKNGIDVGRFRFSETTAHEMRKQYGLEGKFVIGHVGHYVAVKNQSFLLTLLPQIQRIQPNAVLLMFGEGTDREKLEELIKENHLESTAKLMGNTRDVNQVLSAFDIFVFPSLFEGTPLALIEAQANGLPCVISDNIPKDACLTRLIKRIPLDNRNDWIEAITTAKRDFDTDWAEEISRGYETVDSSMNELYKMFSQYHNKRRDTT